jgi:hypothetical protein
MTTQTKCFGGRIRNFILSIIPLLLVVGCGSQDLNDSKTLDDIIAVADDAGKMHKREEYGEVLLFMPRAQVELPFEVRA